MKINQLFVTPIDDDCLIKDLLSCFNLKSLEDTSSFSVIEMKKNKSLIYFDENILSRLKSYYLPCKANVYLTNVTEVRMITIFRQILKTFNYRLATTKKTINKDKLIFYNIEPIGYSKKKVAINSKMSTICFD